MTARGADGRKGAAAPGGDPAAEGADLRRLMEEMLALAMVLPVRGLMQGAELREPPDEEAVEAGFDNLPV